MNHNIVNIIEDEIDKCPTKLNAKGTKCAILPYSDELVVIFLRYLSEHPECKSDLDAVIDRYSPGFLTYTPEIVWNYLLYWYDEEKHKLLDYYKNCVA